MTIPYPSPYCALSSCKILGQNNDRFLDNCKSLQKKGKKGAKNADFRIFLTFVFNFGPFLLILNQQKKFKISKKMFSKFEKFVPKLLILAYLFTKNELYGQNDHSIPKSLLCL